MKWGQGHVDPWWDDSFKNLNYIWKPIPNQDMIPIWDEKYGKGLKYTGGVYDMSQPTPDYALPFLTLMKDWQHVGISFFKQNPLEALPLHRDTYTRYQEVHKLTNPNLIYRCIVFLEDWKSGHYLEVDGTGIVNWNKGDYVYWNYNTEHYAGNFGTEARHTLQITGTYSG
jgi:hypothetical protein